MPKMLPRMVTVARVATCTNVVCSVLRATRDNVTHVLVREWEMSAVRVWIFFHGNTHTAEYVAHVAPAPPKSALKKKTEIN